MSITIDQHVQNLDFDTFTHLNDLCFPNEPVTESEYQEFLAANFWAIHSPDEFIGYSVMTIREQRAHIRRICIHPDFRLQGLAKKLMDGMLEKSKAKGVRLIDLLVQQDNQPAIDLYRKCGFGVTGASIQFSVPIISAEVENYSAIEVDEYRKSENYTPHNQRILDWELYHNPPHRLVLIFLKQDTPIGFARFSPEFPGCSPFELFTDTGVDHIQSLVSLLAKYALPNKKTIKITTENPHVIRLFKSARTEENYRLYKMVKTLVERGLQTRT